MTLPWRCSLARHALIPAAAVAVARWSSQEGRPEASPGHDVRNPATLAIPTLDGEIVCGMRCVESRPARYTWISWLRIWQMSLVWLLAAACLVLPVAVDNRGELLTGDPEKVAAILILVMSLLGTGILVALLFLPIAERRVQERGIERGVDEPRLRLAPGGLVNTGTIVIPRSSIVGFTADKATHRVSRQRDPSRPPESTACPLALVHSIRRVAVLPASARTATSARAHRNGGWSRHRRQAHAPLATRRRRESSGTSGPPAAEQAGTASAPRSSPRCDRAPCSAASRTPGPTDPGRSTASATRSCSSIRRRPRWPHA